MSTPPHYESPASPLAGVVDELLELGIAPSWSRGGYLARRHLFHWDDRPLPRMDGRVVVLTGFTSGLGLAASSRLADLGAHLHLVGRDPDKVRDRAGALRASGGRVTTSVADLSDLEAVRALADEIGSSHPTVDVLVHNAGALTHEWTPSRQGIE